MVWFVIIFLIGLICVLYSCMEVRNIVIKEEDVFLKRLPQAFSGLRVGFISDIHVDSEFDMRFYKKQLETMKTFQPDLLLLGGDYSNDPKNLREVLQLAAAIQPPLGVVAVRGNHDKCVTKAEFLQIIKEANIQTGFDDICYIHKEDKTIAIACLDDYEIGNNTPNKAFCHHEPQQCTICLAHQPKSIVLLSKQNPDVASWIDAAFCGHTHAGQVTFFGLWGIRTNRFIPVRKNQWVSINGIRTMESNGMGQRWNIRFFAKPQIHCMTWLAEKE